MVNQAQQMQPQQQLGFVQATPNIPYVQPTQTTPTNNYTQAAQTTPGASYAQPVHVTPTSAPAFVQTTPTAAVAQFTPSMAFSDLFQSSPSTVTAQTVQPGVVTPLARAGQVARAGSFSQPIQFTPSIAFSNLPHSEIPQASLSSPFTLGHGTSPTSYTAGGQTPAVTYAQPTLTTPAVPFAQVSQTPGAASYAGSVHSTPVSSIAQPLHPVGTSLSNLNVQSGQATLAASQARSVPTPSIVFADLPASWSTDPFTQTGQVTQPVSQAQPVPTPSIAFADLPTSLFSNTFTQTGQATPALSYAQASNVAQTSLPNIHAQLGHTRQTSQGHQTAPAVTVAQPTQVVTASTQPLLAQPAQLNAALPSPQVFQSSQVHSGLSPIAAFNAAQGHNQTQPANVQLAAQRQLHIPQPKSILGVPVPKRSKPVQKGAARRAVSRPETNRQSPTPKPLAAQKPKKVTKPSRPNTARSILLADLTKKRPAENVEGLLRQQYCFTDPIPKNNWQNAATPPKPPAVNMILSGKQIMQWQIENARCLKFLGINGPYLIGDYLCEIHSKTGELIKIATRLHHPSDGWSWVNVMNGNPYQSPDLEQSGRPIATSDGAFLGLAHPEKAPEDRPSTPVMLQPLATWVSADREANLDPQVVQGSPLKEGSDPVFFQTQ